MLRLNLSREPSWHDLGHGVRLLCAPITTAVRYQVRHDPQVVALRGETVDEDGLPVLDDLGRALLSLAAAKAMAKAIALDWEGVGDAEGNPAALSPEGIDALLDIQIFFIAFQLKVVAQADLLVTEKNV